MARATNPTGLELGGSDAFIVLEAADLDETARAAAAARFQNAGRSCNAAKRVVVVDHIARHFLDRFNAEVERQEVSDRSWGMI